MIRPTSRINQEISIENENQMPALRIGIVEDEIVIAENISDALQQLGYDVIEPANDYIEAVSMITKHKPDLVLLDIMLNDDLDGIDLATRINKEFRIPFIFLTANADKATITRAKGTEPAAYLVKPFTKNDLFASIEIAATRLGLHGNNKGLEGTVFVKDGNTLRKLVLHEIHRLESDRVYLNVHTRSKAFLIRKSIGQMLEELNDPRFVQVHRSHVVNVHQVNEVGSDFLMIGEDRIPLSRANKKQFLDLLKNSNH